MRDNFRLKKPTLPKPSKTNRKMAGELKDKTTRPMLRKLWHNRLINLDESITITNALIGSIGEGVIMVDEYSYISHVNQPALDILGFEHSELEGRWLKEVLPSFDKSGRPISPEDRLLARSMLT